MPAPLAKGLIIAASVLVAAGLAIYESPQVRQWVDQSRRKIAVALHSLGDEVQPRRNSSDPSDNGQDRQGRDDEARRRRREEIVRRNRVELLRKAREEGVAVDLDELARIGREGTELEMREFNARNRGSSFDDIVGSDGMLRDNHPLIKIEDEGKDKTAKTVSGMDSSIIDGDDGLRRRARGLQGLQSGASFANPFVDEPSLIIFDQAKEQEAQSNATTTVKSETRESTATIEGDRELSQTSEKATTETPFIGIPPPSPAASIHSFGSREPLIPISASEHLEQQHQLHFPDPDQDQEHDQASQSFYSFASASASSLSASYSTNHHPQSSTHIFSNYGEGAEVMSTGTLTPTEEDGFSSAASLIGSQADDIAVLSMTQHDHAADDDDDVDARSEAFSETGFTEAGFSEAGFSELGEDRLGVHTPGSWTDVGSESGSEFGGVVGTGQWGSTVHQL
ncbi:hypothetical protein AOQ84DRAFT_229271 [Glonium stellatum]|uniref:Uncharacterized protein n=1 Tax=Glonium stellatum TaxID=574774 RepID=A0A8E2F6J4_9PEZI|nr:hypothetical protein AOQ84DRAFT_229271 [Glonium stellatum]